MNAWPYRPPLLVQAKQHKHTHTQEEEICRATNNMRKNGRVHAQNIIGWHSVRDVSQTIGKDERKACRADSEHTDRESKDETHISNHLPR